MAEDLTPHISIQACIVAHQVSKGGSNVSAIDPDQGGNIGRALDSPSCGARMGASMASCGVYAMQPCHNLIEMFITLSVLVEVEMHFTLSGTCHG